MFYRKGNLVVAFTLISIILSLSFMACQEDPIFSEIKEINREDWHYEDPLVFQPNISDTSALYNVSVILDHMKSYPFENLYLRITQQAGQESQTDTLSFDIISSEGYYKGSCDDESCRMEAKIYDQIRYVQPGPLTFTIEQFTRNESLAGVNAVGLVIRKADEILD